VLVVLPWANRLERDIDLVVQPHGQNSSIVAVVEPNALRKDWDPQSVIHSVLTVATAQSGDAKVDEG
jgi:hypothetical protein